MISYFAQLLDITIINATIPSDWKKAMVVPIYKKGDSNFNLMGLHASGTCYSIEPEENLR
jgi:hypothetical protein